MIFNDLELTEVWCEDEHGCDVDDDAEDLGDDHGPVPRPYRQRHHQQLGDNQRRERDGDDVHELALEQPEGAVHDDPALVDAY